MEIKFCHYNGNNIDDLKEMIFELYNEDPEGMPITEEKIIKTVNESIRHPEKVQIIMIHCGNSNIGYGIITFLWSNEYGGDVINIDELFITEEYRNQRAATEFFEYLFEVYKNVVLFELEVTPSNKGALRLYENLGFKSSANTHMIYYVNTLKP